MDPLTIGLALASQFAPTIVKYFTNNDTAATVAGQVVSIAKTVTGIADPVAAQAAIQLDPALQIQFRTAVMANETDLEKAYLTDRADARSHDIELRKLTGGSNFRADLAVLAVVLGLMACLFVLIQYKAAIPGEVVGILATIAGIFGSCLKDYFAFEFGSSRSSQAKDSTIANLSKT